MENKYALIDNETGYLINIIVWDGVTKYNPPPNTSVKLLSELKPEELIYPPDKFTESN